MKFISTFILSLTLCSVVTAQSHEQQPMQQMPAGMDMGHDNSMSMSNDMPSRTTAGTSSEPASTAREMLMTKREAWRFMFHGNAFLTLQEQSGPRGADKFFSTNWFMPMAQRDLGPGQLTLRFMASLEPATVTGRYFPELLQQGETAFGRPIRDGQHPHDFIMELAAIYDWRVASRTVLTFYAAPVGDAALGPEAYPHRASASEDPLASLGHHLQDSTHIADDVLTVGVTHRALRMEFSGFHGREPDEDRWDIDGGRLDSWAGRVTVNPTKNWSAQFSMGRLTSPEAQHPEDDEFRMTASIMYSRPLARGAWESTLVYGRNREIPGDMIWSSYLAESTLHFAAKNALWGRIENVDRTNDLLGLAASESVLARVQAYTGGYDREVWRAHHLSAALGAQLTSYHVPNKLRTIYGSHPAGVAIFLRLSPVQ